MNQSVLLVEVISTELKKCVSIDLETNLTCSKCISWNIHFQNHHCVPCLFFPKKVLKNGTRIETQPGTGIIWCYLCQIIPLQHPCPFQAKKGDISVLSFQSRWQVDLCHVVTSILNNAGTEQFSRPLCRSDLCNTVSLCWKVKGKGRVSTMSSQKLYYTLRCDTIYIYIYIMYNIYIYIGIQCYVRVWCTFLYDMEIDVSVMSMGPWSSNLPTSGTRCFSLVCRYLFWHRQRLIRGSGRSSY